MKLYQLKHVLLLLLAMILASCNVKSRQTTPLQPVSTPTLGEEIPSTKVASRSHDTDIRARIVASDLEIVGFGWLPDGSIYYGVGGDPQINSYNSIPDIHETTWYSFDAASLTVDQIESPYPQVQEDVLQIITQNGMAKIFDVTISPSGNTIIYTRLPLGYQSPKPLPPHYFSPAEIWVAANRGQENFPISNEPENWHDCGSNLSFESSWFDSETLAIGSCYFDYGIVRVYFLVDLLKKKVQFLDFESENGEYIPSEEIAIANHSPSLAFLSEGAFWIVPVESGQRTIPLKLNDSNALFYNRLAIAPVWAPDDRSIYYWTASEPTRYDENGFVEYRPWWLEKLNLLTGEKETVLSEYELHSLMGYDMYELPYAGGNQWRLSKDERNILLYMPETVDSPATLFLFSW